MNTNERKGSFQYAKRVCGKLRLTSLYSPFGESAELIGHQIWLALETQNHINSKVKLVSPRFVG